jgi:hypothetical protein
VTPLPWLLLALAGGGGWSDAGLWRGLAGVPLARAAAPPAEGWHEIADPPEGWPTRWVWGERRRDAAGREHIHWDPARQEAAWARIGRRLPAPPPPAAVVVREEPVHEARHAVSYAAPAYAAGYSPAYAAASFGSAAAWCPPGGT